MTIDDISDECISGGANLEFVIQRREGFPAGGGSIIEADCQLVDDSFAECPGL